MGSPSRKLSEKASVSLSRRLDDRLTSTLMRFRRLPTLSSISMPPLSGPEKSLNRSITFSRLLRLRICWDIVLMRDSMSASDDRRHQPLGDPLGLDQDQGGGFVGLGQLDREKAANHHRQAKRHDDKPSAARGQGDIVAEIKAFGLLGFHDRDLTG